MLVGGTFNGLYGIVNLRLRHIVVVVQVVIVPRVEVLKCIKSSKSFLQWRATHIKFWKKKEKKKLGF